MGNFHPLEVVDRGSETQLHVGENLSQLIVVLIDRVCWAELSPRTATRVYSRF